MGRLCLQAALQSQVLWIVCKSWVKGLFMHRVKWTAQPLKQVIQASRQQVGLSTMQNDSTSNRAFVDCIDSNLPTALHGLIWVERMLILHALFSVSVKFCQCQCQAVCLNLLGRRQDRHQHNHLLLTCRSSQAA